MGHQSQTSYRPLLDMKGKRIFQQNAVKANQALFQISQIQFNHPHKRISNKDFSKDSQVLFTSKQKNLENQVIKQRVQNPTIMHSNQSNDYSIPGQPQQDSVGGTPNKYLGPIQFQKGNSRSSNLKMAVSSSKMRDQFKKIQTETNRNYTEGFRNQLLEENTYLYDKFTSTKTQRPDRVHEYFKDFDEQQMKKITTNQVPFKLTSNEYKIIKFITDALYYNSLDQSVDMMIAGDWVRDKCLGEEAGRMSFLFYSDDCKYALDLAQMFDDFKSVQTDGKPWLKTRKIWKDPGSIYQKSKEKITFNTIYDSTQAYGDQYDKMDPKSLGLRGYEHRSLPVAYVKILDQEIDICKLPHQSNPRFDLLQDAISRDFTINSLYYPIDMDSKQKFNQVIDPLGIGLIHIIKGKIHLCQDASLQEDPLRLFRAIEISAKYDFEISDVIKDQIMDYKKLLPILDQKVKTERLATHLLEMFSDQEQGIKSLKIMSELNVVRNYISRLHEIPYAIPFNKETDPYDLALVFTQAIKPVHEMKNYKNQLFKKIYFLCMMKNLDYDWFDLELRLKEMKLSNSVHKFVFNNLTRYQCVMDFDLGEESENEVHRMKQQDTNNIISILCGEQKYHEELGYSPGLDLEGYIDGYKKYLALSYTDYLQEYVEDRTYALAYQRFMGLSALDQNDTKVYDRDYTQDKDELEYDDEIDNEYFRNVGHVFKQDDKDKYDREYMQDKDEFEYGDEIDYNQYQQDEQSGIFQKEKENLFDKEDLQDKDELEYGEEIDQEYYKEIGHQYF